jgi:hypothetical protein
MRKTDRIFLLEDALVQAQYTLQFVHDCIMNPSRYDYMYPEQTIDFLEELSKLVPLPPMCVHSKNYPGCESCADRMRRAKRRAKIKRK